MSGGANLVGVAVLLAAIGPCAPLAPIPPADGGVPDAGIGPCVEDIDCAGRVVNAAPVRCDEGKCNFAACSTGWSDCDLDRTNGCERAVTSCWETVITDQLGVSSLVSDGTELFWVTDTRRGGGSVRKMTIAGGAVTTLATDAGTASGLVLDATRVYWVTGNNGVSAAGGVYVAPKSGGPAVALATGYTYPGQLCVDFTDVYFVTGENGQSQIRKVPIAGGPVVTLLTGAQPFIYSLALLGSDAWFLLGNDVMKVSKSGGTPIVVATIDEQGRVLSHSFKANSLLWGSRVSETPFTKPADANLFALQYGAAGSTLISHLTFEPHQLVVDGQSIFVAGNNDTTTSGLGAVLQIPLNGGAPAILANEQAPYAIAVDATSVYWAEYWAGEIRRTSK